jgi:hypothetical protein
MFVPAAALRDNEDWRGKNQKLIGKPLMRRLVGRNVRRFGEKKGLTPELSPKFPRSASNTSVARNKVNESQRWSSLFCGQEAASLVPKYDTSYSMRE